MGRATSRPGWSVVRRVLALRLSDPLYYSLDREDLRRARSALCAACRARIVRVPMQGLELLELHSKVQTPRKWEEGAEESMT